MHIERDEILNNCDRRELLTEDIATNMSVCHIIFCTTVHISHK